MSVIVAARFDTFDHARDAAKALTGSGVQADELHTFYVDPPNYSARPAPGGHGVHDPTPVNATRGAMGGAALLGVAGAVVGALIGFGIWRSLLPVALGAGIGAYLGSLLGSLSLLGQKHSTRTSSALSDLKETDSSVRPSGVLLAVRTDAEHVETIAAALRQHGGIEVERAEGHWEDGEWKDFDPLAAQDVQATP
ncbi:MAG TPA: hypothetical protein VK104_10800 [Burkholderiaceae bacterium]|nr:hypothetical protein [Burkholderiaceae bacterium]